MADSQFSPLGTVAAPAAWTLPPSLELVLKTAYAHFDGSGAAGSYVPCLRIKSDSGHVVCEAVASTTVAAGASANVSWFPGVRLPAAAASGGGTAWQWAYISSNGHTACTGPGVTTTIVATAGNFYTNTPSLFAEADFGAGHPGISILAGGHYYVLGNATPFGTPAAGSEYELQIAGGDNVSFFFQGPMATLFPASGLTDMGSLTNGLIMTVATASTPTQAIVGQIVNSAASTVQMALAGLIVVQIDTDETSLS